jgi:hypothetical protein
MIIGCVKREYKFKEGDIACSVLGGQTLQIIDLYTDGDYGVKDANHKFFIVKPFEIESCINMHRR